MEWMFPNKPAGALMCAICESVPLQGDLKLEKASDCLFLVCNDCSSPAAGVCSDFQSLLNNTDDAEHVLVVNEHAHIISNLDETTKTMFLAEPLLNAALFLTYASVAKELFPRYKFFYLSNETNGN
jgi:hypothetical protein